jgi:hypothetical protein
MIVPVPVTLAPNFQLPEPPAGRVLIADGMGWRPAPDNECAAMVTPSVPAGSRRSPVLLFAVPGHLRTSFWRMLEHAGTAEEFDSFAGEVARFLAFKQLPTPVGAVFELVLHGPGGNIDPAGVWAVINLGEDPVAVGVPGRRVRLGPGEGSQLPEEIAADVIPPERDAPAVLLLVRRPAAACLEFR